MFAKERVEESRKLIVKYRINQLSVGRRVIAVHPHTRELKTGSILTSESSQFDVRFDNPDLGIELIKDFNLIPICNSKDT